MAGLAQEKRECLLFIFVFQVDDVFGNRWSGHDDGRYFRRTFKHFRFIFSKALFTLGSADSAVDSCVSA